MDDFAYPDQPLNGHGSPMGAFQSGMTKRELFAAMIFQSLVQLGAGCQPAIAEEAVRGADALISELAKEPK